MRRKNIWQAHHECYSSSMQMTCDPFLNIIKGCCGGSDKSFGEATALGGDLWTLKGSNCYSGTCLVRQRPIALLSKNAYGYYDFRSFPDIIYQTRYRYCHKPDFCLQEIAFLSYSAGHQFVSLKMIFTFKTWLLFTQAMGWQRIGICQVWDFGAATPFSESKIYWGVLALPSVKIMG